MDAYRLLKEKQQKEINAFPFGWAFSNQQFEEMKIKLGVTENSELLSIGAGGFIRKTDRDAMNKMFDKHEKERKEARKAKKNGEDYLYQMFNYELANHEYCITYDVTDTLEALGLTKEDVEKDEKMKEALKKACENQIKQYAM